MRPINTFPGVAPTAQPLGMPGTALPNPNGPMGGMPLSPYNSNAFPAGGVQSPLAPQVQPMQGGFGQPQGSMPATLGGMPGQPMSGMPTQTGMAQQALMGGQPMGGQPQGPLSALPPLTNAPLGMPTQTGMAQQAPTGGQQLQVRSQPEVFNSPFSPQQREQYLQSENLANYPPIPQVQQPYGGFGQQPGMGGQQGIMQQTYNDFLRQTGLPANLMQPGMGGQQPPLGQTPPGMQRIGEGPRQQPRSAAELAAMGYISEPMRNAPPPQQPPQKQDITAGLRAKAAGMTPQQMQSITQQMRAGAAGMTPEQRAAITAQMRKGPQPNNPLAQPKYMATGGRVQLDRLRSKYSGGC